MKLITADASPFGRKCKIVVHELGLTERVEFISPGAVTPVSINQDVISVNPLGMIPILETPDGDSLFDSPVIAEYLNTDAKGDLFPADFQNRFRSLKLQALADGIMDISVAIRYETALRPEPLRWKEWIEHQGLAVDRGLATLNQLCPTFSGRQTIGEIAVACALGYRDFRFPGTPWREHNPALAEWFEEVGQKPAMQATVPA
ncbi:MAG: glutathione S-transferase family protein [Granulosicoccus sp.]|nr:glutathione S-transferase family protein [Granulosicoccus sp.]